MNGFSVDPGERLACVPLTCPSIDSSKKLADPTTARTLMSRVSTSIALAL